MAVINFYNYKEVIKNTTSGGKSLYFSRFDFLPV